jgi:hypothetical protein
MNTGSASDCGRASAAVDGPSAHGSTVTTSCRHPAYYGAFVIDPDGNHIEAVCHAPA